MDRGAWWATAHGVTESDMTQRLTLFCCDFRGGLSDLCVLLPGWVTHGPGLRPAAQVAEAAGF